MELGWGGFDRAKLDMLILTRIPFSFHAYIYKDSASYGHWLPTIPAVGVADRSVYCPTHTAVLSINPTSHRLYGIFSSSLMYYLAFYWPGCVLRNSYVILRDPLHSS